MEPVLVTKKVSFDAAHYLPGYEGPCAAMHGHHWVVEVGVSGPVLDNGMVMDFKDLKVLLEPVVGRFDHSLLNDILEVPTAENLGQYIACTVSRDFSYLQSKELKLEFVRVWETKGSMVEVRL